MQVSIVGPTQGEVPLTGPVRMRILEDGSTTAHRLGLGEITIAPHTEGPQQHRHAQHDEGFYVVSGTVRFTVGSDIHDATAGTLVMVPPGAPHTFANPGDEPAVLLNTFTPDLYVQYFRDLRDMIAAGQTPTDEAVAGVMARYGTEPATEAAPVSAARPDVGALRVDDRGEGRPFLLLHGGAGPASVLGLAERLAGPGGARVLTPTIPGFDGTPRLEGVTTIGDVAAAYLELLEDRDLHDVTVVGSSVGGWVAAEMALRQTDDAEGRVGGIVLVDAVGIAVEGDPVTDISGMALDAILELSYHDATRFRVDPATMPAERRDALAANAAVFSAYAGDPYMHDPALRERLAAVRVPVLVLWGESDGVVDLDYGRAYAAAFSAPEAEAEFVVVREAGHLPQIEQPDTTHDLVRSFAAQRGTRSTARG